MGEVGSSQLNLPVDGRPISEVHGENVRRRSGTRFERDLALHVQMELFDVPPEFSTIRNRNGCPPGSNLLDVVEASQRPAREHNSLELGAGQRSLQLFQGACFNVDMGTRSVRVSFSSRRQVDTLVYETHVCSLRGVGVAKMRVEL